jgi:hypothetical protein
VLELGCSEAEIRDIETQRIRKARLELGFENVYTILEGGQNPMSDPEVRARHRAATSESPEWRERNVENNRRLAQDPVWRARHDEAMRNKSQEGLNNIAAANVASKAKHYVFLDPDGYLVEVFNLTEFCRQNGLDKSSMSQVALGKRPQHKGWTLPTD